MEHNSIYAKLLLIWVLATAVLTACITTNDPTSDTLLAEIVTVSVERPSASATPQPSKTPTLVKTATETAVLTKTPYPSSTSRPTDTQQPESPTATVILPLVWSEYYEQLANFERVSSVKWSPNQNELIYQTCEGRYINGFNFDGSIFKGSAPTFDTVNLAQDDFQFCKGAMDLTWSPNGNQIVFAGSLPDDTDLSMPSTEFSEVWLMGTEGENPHPILPGKTIRRWLSFYKGWLHDDFLVYTGYAGGGHISFGFINIQTKENTAWAIVHLGSGEPNLDYFAVDDGATYESQISAAIISTVPQHPTVDNGFNSPYLHHLSFDDESRKFNFYSRYQDWLPHSNEMLVLTWGISKDLFNRNLVKDEAVTSIQLWNVESDELEMLVPRATYGRFSPDGRFLLYLTPSPEYPIAHLYDWQNEQMVLEQPVVATHDQGSFIKFEMSFSPDGRYLSYFTPNADGATSLQLIDTATGQLTWQFTNPVTAISWSPMSDQFIIRDLGGNLTLFTVADDRSIPLTTAGGLFIYNPQWSYDGRYLSVSVQKEGGGETAVLTLIASSTEN